MLVLLAACSGPERAALEGTWEGSAPALAAAERGEAALAAGDPTTALAAFREARQHRAEPVLAAWEGEALAASGDLASAESAYRDALRGDPGLHAARWRLALVLARQGRHADATVELQRAIGDGAGSALDVRGDPDWAPFLDDPAYGFVPAAVLAMEAEPLAERTYWGSDLSVRIVAEGRFGPTIALRAASVTGPVRLRSLVEEGRGETRRFVASFRVVGAGEIAIGPISLASAGGTVEIPALTSTASAPPGKVPPKGASAPLLSVDTLPTGIERRDGVLWVPAAPGEAVALEPKPAEDPVRYERRGPGDARTLVWAFPDAPPGAKLTVGPRVSTAP